jgi:capsid protein
MTPMDSVKLKTGHRLVHGVELDAGGRQVAYWVRQDDDSFKRLPAYGEKSGRRLAWLVYGTDRRLDEVRGKPILALVLQSLKEIDRYRDSVQRKATINSMVAMFIKKNEPKMGTRPMTASGGALRKGASVAEGADGTPRSFKASEQIPGLVIEELQHGEEPTPYPSHGTDDKFAEFEAAVLYAIAWAFEIPPEILVLAFKSSYSASQASGAEFKMYLNKVRTKFGEDFCTPIYVEWLVSAALTQKVKAPKLLEAFRDLSQYETFCAWTSCDWSGHIKPAIDQLKAAKGMDAMVAAGYITRDRASRELTGTKFSKNVQTLRLENLALAEANRPIVELESPPAPAAKAAPPKDSDAPEEGVDEKDKGDDDNEEEAA